jgi:hypothetical protein
MNCGLVAKVLYGLIKSGLVKCLVRETSFGDDKLRYVSKRVWHEHAVALVGSQDCAHTGFSCCELAVHCIPGQYAG